MANIFEEIDNQLIGFNKDISVRLKEQTENYIKKFQSTDEVYNKHIQLKKIHVFRVLKEINDLCTDLNVPENVRYCAHVLAMLHDIGRFEQYHKYRTFADAKTENHSEIAIRITEEQGFIKDLSFDMKSLVYKAILNHNIPRIIPGHPRVLDLLSRLLRDADKLDIWRVALEHDVWHTIENYSRDTNYSVPDNIMNCFIQHRTVPIELAPTLADSYLLRISWIFDINFKPSFVKINSRNIVSRFLAKFFSTDEIQKIERITEEFIQEKLNSVSVLVSNPVYI